MDQVLQHHEPTPLWTLLVLLTAAVAATFLIHRRDPISAVPWWGWLPFLLRAGAVGGLVWMCGGWWLQRYRTEPAGLLVVIDDSLSMTHADTYADRRAAATVADLAPPVPAGSPRQVANRWEVAQALLIHPRSGWLDWMMRNYRVRLWAAGATPRTIPDRASLQGWRAEQPASRLGQSLHEVLAGQRESPPAAVILLTDGVTTGGPPLESAAQAARRLGVPWFVVGLGSDQPARDLRLGDLLADDVAFAGDVVQMEARLTAEGFPGHSAQVRLVRTDTGVTLAEEQVTLQKPTEQVVVRLQFRPTTLGPLPLAIEVAAAPGESDRANNRLTHVLHVNDAVIKVLLVQAFPSYEYRFLKDLLSRATRASDPAARAFDLSTVLQEADREHREQDPTAGEFPATAAELAAFDVVVFGDVDPRLLRPQAAEDLVAMVREGGKSLVLVAGRRFTPHAYREHPLAELFPCRADTLTAPELEPASEPFQARLTPLGSLDPACRLETTAGATRAAWNGLPPLYWTYPLPAIRPGARTLLEHPTRRRADGSPLPLLVTQYFGKGRVIFQATDETYRWARGAEDQNYYGLYWLQLLRSLARPKLLASRDGGDLTTDRQQYTWGETVRVRAKLRQQSSTSEIVLEQPDGVRRQIPLRSDETDLLTWQAELEHLAPGDYRIFLTSPLVDSPPPPRAFTVVVPNQEPVGVPLDAAGLEAAARTTGGRYYSWYQSQRLPRDLPAGRRTRLEPLPPLPLWNSPWLAGLWIAAVVSEWFLRQRLSHRLGWRR